MNIVEIDRQCDLFEQRLKAGQSISVEAFVREQHLPADVSLLAELEKLLHVYTDQEISTKAWDSPALPRRPSAGDDKPTTGSPSPDENVGQLHGRYQVQDEIARGGMGAIIRCRDVELGRDLAIKVLLDRHKDRPEIVQRFVEEAQIGGQLQHPGIAPVHEMGTLPDGRLFFSMKLVQGETLSSLLRQRESPAQDRAKFLGIFEQVCQTLAFAHSRGVIHRDLKPSNIMVGAFGEVQVMDWGLAKVLHQRGAGDELPTQPAQPDAIRTVRATSDTDLPTATRIGSRLGTPAYMALEQARGQVHQVDERADVFGLGAILCAILTGAPPYRGKSGEALSKAEAGDLADAHARLDACGAEADLIVLAKRCLSARRSDRPRDAGVLAAEMSAYLESVEQRLRQAEAEAAGRKEAEAVAKLLESIFRDIDPREASDDLNGQIASRLDAIVANVEEEHHGSPLVRARIKKALGQVFLGLGEFDKAEALFQESLDIRQQQLAAVHPDVLESRCNLAQVYWAKGESKTAVPIYEQVVAMMKDAPDVDPRARLAAQHDLGTVYREVGRFDEARQLHEEVLDQQQQILPPNHRDIPRYMSSLAGVYWTSGNPQQAISLYEQAREIMSANVGQEHPDMLTLKNNLATAYRDAGRPEKAQPLLEAVLAVQMKRLPIDHLHILFIKSNLAGAYWADARPDLAAPTYEEVLRGMEAKFGPDSSNTAVAKNNLATAYRDAGQPERALPLFNEVLETQRADFPADDPRITFTIIHLGHACRLAGQLERSIEYLEQARSRIDDDQDPTAIRATGHLGAACRRHGRLNEALELLAAADAGAWPNPFRAREFWIRSELIAAYNELGNFDMSERLVGELLAAAREDLPSSSPRLALLLADLGASYLDCSQDAKAEPLLRESLTLWESIQPVSPQLARVRGLLEMLRTPRS